VYCGNEGGGEDLHAGEGRSMDCDGSVDRDSGAYVEKGGLRNGVSRGDDGSVDGRHVFGDGACGDEGWDLLSVNEVRISGLCADDDGIRSLVADVEGIAGLGCHVVRSGGACIVD
jgi:hypothetical protein